MQNDSTDDITTMLIKYMDGELNESDRQAAETRLLQDVALQERYQYFLAAKKAIRSQGLQQRVAALHQEYMQETEASIPVKVIKPTSFLKTFMSVAAVLIVVIAGYSVFQYTATTNQAVYSDNFVAYQLPVNRGNEVTAQLDALYNAGNYNAVVNTFNAAAQKKQKDCFLAAQSYLQLNNANAAINAFKEVEALNAKSTEKYFEQETDYYLALAYIKAGNIDAAKTQLSKITSNKQHLFYSKAKDISHIKLMLLKWKDK